MEDILTNEKLRGSFKDSFELTHFAIQVGRAGAFSGDISLKNVLDWVRKNPNEESLEDLKKVEKEDQE